MSIRTEGVSPVRQRLRDCHRLALNCRLLIFELDRLSSGRQSSLPRHIQKRKERRRCTQEQLQSGLSRLMERVLEVEEMLEGLPVHERLLLRAYYVEGLLWREVEPVVGYRKSQVDRVHRRAMKRLEYREGWRKA